MKSLLTHSLCDWLTSILCLITGMIQIPISEKLHDNTFYGLWSFNHSRVNINAKFLNTKIFSLCFVKINTASNQQSQMWTFFPLPFQWRVTILIPTILLFYVDLHIDSLYSFRRINSLVTFFALVLE